MEVNEGHDYFLSNAENFCLESSLWDRHNTHLSITSTLRVIFHKACFHFEQFGLFFSQPLYFI